MSLNDLFALPASEKLHIIEQLWDRLDDADVISPSWHQDRLEERKRRYDRNEIGRVSLETFKKQRRSR